MLPLINRCCREAHVNLPFSWCPRVLRELPPACEDFALREESSARLVRRASAGPPGGFVIDQLDWDQAWKRTHAGFNLPNWNPGSLKTLLRLTLVPTLSEARSRTI
jgi:hypothetical protein